MHDMQEEQTSRGARDGASVRPITIIDHRALVRINAVTIMTRVKKKVDAELRRRRQGHTKLGTTHAVWMAKTIHRTNREHALLGEDTSNQPILALDAHVTSVQPSENM